MLYRMTTGAPIFGLRREIDRLFEDTFGREGGNFTPAVDIKENESEIRLELELPGLKPDQVEITAENGILTVRGEKQSERKEGEDNRYLTGPQAGFLSRVQLQIRSFRVIAL